MPIKFILLGSGSSMGVPRPDGYWGKCDPNEKKNYRTRCSALISTKNSNTLIDTSPDLRLQLIKEKIDNVDRVLYSHMHADQTHGINDLRVFFIKNKKKLNVYGDKLTNKYLKKTFLYCFKDTKNYPAILKLNLIKKKMIFYDKKQKIEITSIPVKHGSIDCLSFIINKTLAYASDVNLIYRKDLNNFKNLKYLVIDCLRFSKHPAHYNLDEILELNKVLKPKKTILTNLHSDLDYNYLLNNLPNNVIPGYDGISFNI
jgi:phosphoribosyl 1,2-cyclic phosphate phosphodiesterase